jgi:hypothetical protein
MQRNTINDLIALSVVASTSAVTLFVVVNVKPMYLRPSFVLKNLFIS